MKNIQISDNDCMGKRFNGHDLHRYLNEAGISSKEIVWNKFSDSPNTASMAAEITDRHEFNQAITKLERYYDVQSVLYPFSFDLLSNQDFLEADIVHLHLIHNYFFNITHLPILSRLKPIVWTLHDPWALAGHCIHSFDCERWIEGCGLCPNLKTHFSIQQDTSALNWEMKKIYYQASILHIIVASQWMLDLVKKSPLFAQCKTYLVPFGIDLNVFKPADNHLLKQYFNIPTENFVIGFRAATWPLKGLSYIKQMISQLDPKIPITFMVSSELHLVDDLKEKYQVIELGWIDDDDVLVKYYSVCDVFLMPSLAESFGMSAIESMACGTPVIVFANTVLSDTIEAPKGGFAVEKGNACALKETVEQLYKDRTLLHTMSLNARLIAEKKYDKNEYVKKIMDVYQEVLASYVPDTRRDFIIAEQLKKIPNEGITLNPPVFSPIPAAYEEVAAIIKSKKYLELWSRINYFFLLKIKRPLGLLKRNLIRMLN